MQVGTCLVLTICNQVSQKYSNHRYNSTAEKQEGCFVYKDKNVMVDNANCNSEPSGLQCTPSVMYLRAHADDPETYRANKDPGLQKRSAYIRDRALSGTSLEQQQQTEFSQVPRGEFRCQNHRATGLELHLIQFNMMIPSCNRHWVLTSTGLELIWRILIRLPQALRVHSPQGFTELTIPVLEQ